jgi:Spy/CpxP family protein refolding chaperone
MQRSKFLAALVLIGTFLGGIAVGVAADRVMRPTLSGGDQVDARTYWNRVSDEWALSTSQRAVIDSLMDAQRRKITTLYAPLRPAVDSVNKLARAVSDSTQTQLRLILTPTQRVKLDELRAEMKRRRDEHRARRDDDLAKIR